MIPAAVAARGTARIEPRHLSKCWRDGCEAKVRPTDQLGLCGDCIHELQEASR